MKGELALLKRIRLLRKGFVKVHICGGNYERFLNLCANHGILLWDIQPAQRGYEAKLYRKDFFSLKPLAKKCRTRVRVRRKYGLPFFLYRHRKRKVFALGLCFCGFFIFFLSCFIWNITIHGNLSISRQTLMEYLASRQITYGTRKSALDCRQLAADLRNDFPGIIWVSVRLTGTYLQIDLQENTDRPEAETENAPEASDLVADADGTIVSMITREGLPVAGKGDKVKKGDVLVKGEMEITDDADNVVNYRYCRSDADIYIRTTIPYEDTFSLAHEIITYTGRKRYAVYLKLFGRYFGVDPGLRCFADGDIMGTERQLRLPGNIYLPASAGILSAREYKRTVVAYTKEEAIALAKQKLQKFLLENEQKGVQIFENNVKIEVSTTSCRAKGTLTVIKKTGRSVRIKKSDFPQEGTNE